MFCFSTREKGVHRNELVQQLNVPLGKILYVSLYLPLIHMQWVVCNPFLPFDFFALDREAIESLEAEGLVYSTIDECHYKSTANA